MEIIVMAIFLVGSSIFGTAVWSTATENSCWKDEAKVAFEKYGSLATRAEILRTAEVKEDPRSNPVEVIEDHYNGCSVGSNGRTAFRFYFNDESKLTRMQVLRHYEGATELSLIEDKKF